jgi:tRNA(Ile)-lysidine synthase
LPAGPPPQRLVVALSGGLDSIVLLHSLQQLIEQRRIATPLLACHVNHHINPRADQWQQFCEAFCARHGIPLEVLQLWVDTAQSAALEERAREARYLAFGRLLQDGDLLLMAHHLDDQLETLLLRLSRGAGPGGLAGMPARRAHGRGNLLRPQLDWSRPALRDYANAQGLSWVDDDSNADVRFDRNFIRHEILPAIARRWPDYREAWQKSQHLCDEADRLLQVLAGQDLATLATDHPAVIDLQPMQTWDGARRRNVLRHWLRGLGVADPGWNLLLRLSQEVLPAAQDAEASLPWRELHLQRYRQRLYALSSETPSGLPEPRWQPLQQATLQLPGNGSLASEPAECGLGLSPSTRLHIRYRQGGERCRLAGRPEKTVKRLLQEAAVPPWLRERFPLLYVDDELVCLPGIGVAASHASAGQGLIIRWVPPDVYYRPTNAGQSD